MLLLGGSPVESQAVVIGDRRDCLKDLSPTLDAGNEMQIKDTSLEIIQLLNLSRALNKVVLTNVECGCKDSLFNDQAHSFPNVCFKALISLEP